MVDHKKCLSCGAYLIRFQEHYLHPDKPCAGIRDYIDIEATISDDVLHEQFIKMYGSPRINDSDDVIRLEEHKKLLIKGLRDRADIITEQSKWIKHPLIALIIKILSMKQKKDYQPQQIMLFQTDFEKILI